MNLEENALKKITEFKSIFDGESYSSATIERKQYNFEFSVSENGEKVKVQVYFGKKGVKVVIQGNKESSFYREISSIVYDQQQLGFTEKPENEPDKYIGSDESGKGDVFGPLVTCAFYVDPETKAELIKLGVRDSKDLTDYQIHGIARQIKKQFPEKIEIVPINPEKYNELYQKFNNLNLLLNWAHSKAINNLLSRIECENIISDKFSNKELNIDQRLNDNRIDILQIPKAEKYLGVAAASIIARDVFSNWFKKKKRDGVNLPKGASQEVTTFLKEYIQKENKGALGKISKLHFKTIKKLI